MRILIGILYCIENEFKDCLNSISSQNYKNFEYFVIQNKPNKEAHDTLYSIFMERARDFDLFIKIDADMVLCRKDFFEKVVEKMILNPDVDLIETWVHDFFTDALIGSLNTFRNTVTWNIENEQIFVDRITNYKRRLTDKEDLAPAAFHCPNPLPFQSFHFGVHKAIKACQFYNYEKQLMPAIEHWNNIVLTKMNFLKSGDLRIGLAALGAEMAIRKRFTSKQSEYSNLLLISEFKKYENWDLKKIRRKLNSFSIQSYSFLPDKWRHDILFKINSGWFFGFINFQIARQILKMIYFECKKILFPSAFMKITEKG